MSKDNPKWVTFMRQRAPLTGKTFEDIAYTALNSHDARTFTEILSLYKQSIGEPPHRNPDVLSRQRPGAYRKADTPPHGADTKTYTRQEYMNMESQILSNPALLKDASFSAQWGEMRKARDEGRITL
jgi:hypothetical protein